ncbi:MAG: ATP-binding protein, partial [Armatimonadetes bacterium]
ALEVTLVSVDLRAQASQVLESFDREQAAQVRFSGESVRAVGDPERVRQIVRNLVSNALRYGGDTIRLEVVRNGATASVLVCDNGPAIPEEDRERIFQPYQRAHNAPGIAGSIGLGLAISRQLAQLMDGDLTYRHDNGESIFDLALPVNA